MKKFLLFIILSFAFANAQFFYDKHGESRGAYKDSMEYAKLVELAQRFRGPILVKKPVEGVKPRKNLKKIPQDKIQRTFDVNRDSLRKELWLEVEKNEIVKICVDGPVVAWETSLESAIINDSCLVFQAPTLIGVETLSLYLSNADSTRKINLAVGMKYLNFKGEKVLLGYNQKKRKVVTTISGKSEQNEDPERFVSVTGTYLIDKYPVTNCEITQLLWDSIPQKVPNLDPESKRYTQNWMLRKKKGIHKENCLTHDSAAASVYLYQAMVYANVRSIQEQLKPFYIFSASESNDAQILSEDKYIIGYWDFSKHKESFIQVSIDSSSDGYRLPFYDEWMMYARGGDKKNKAIWGDSSASIKEVLKYARFGTGKYFDKSEPVGQLKPNGFGLYDIFGLVWEHVLFKTKNPFHVLMGSPSCLKGGGNLVLTKDDGEYHSEPHWKSMNYSSSRPNFHGNVIAGFRLIRNIGNNATWEKVEAKTK